MSRAAVNFLYKKPKVKVIHRNGVDIFVHVNKFKGWEQNTL